MIKGEDALQGRSEYWYVLMAGAIALRQRWILFGANCWPDGRMNDGYYPGDRCQRRFVGSAWGKLRCRSNCSFTARPKPSDSSHFAVCSRGPAFVFWVITARASE